MTEKSEQVTDLDRFRLPDPLAVGNEQKTDTEAAAEQNAPRSRRYVSLTFEEIRKLLQSPADRLVLVIKAYSDMQSGKPDGCWVKLTSARFSDAGIFDSNRKSGTVNKLEAAGVIEVRR